MPTDFSLFRDRLAEACRIRGMTSDAVCRSIGMGGRRTLDVQSIGLHALDLYRVCQIADRLSVSVDWRSRHGISFEKRSGFQASVLLDPDKP